MASKTSFNEEPSGAHAPKPTLVRILTIVLLYAAFAALWILLSDKAMLWLFTDPSDLALASTLKGFLFVAVTSLLLYALIQRLLGSTRTATELFNGRRQLFFFLGMSALAIVGMTTAGVYYTVIQYRDRAAAQLQAIVDLKTRQVEDWLAERYGDARFIQSNPYWTILYHQWHDQQDQESWKQLQERINEFRINTDFDYILLLEGDGRFLWSSDKNVDGPNPVLTAAVRRHPRDQVTHVGPYADAAGRLYLDFIAPLPEGTEPSPTVVLNVDPRKHLFSLLQSWPAPSPTGEILLFRRDGDDILYLNELRHQKGTAVKLRRPIREENSVAAEILGNPQALGKPLEGIDYRGESVFFIATAVGGTDWFLAAKLDESELFSNALKDAVWICLAGLLGIFIATAGVILFRQHQELAAALRESEIKAEKLRALELLGAISEASSDAIFAKDKRGCYLLFNREAGRLVGLDPQQVLGRDDESLFPPEQAALIKANDRQVMQQNHAASFQESLSTIEGEIIFQATKGPLHDPDGNVIGMFGISRDITELKNAEEALRDIKQRLHLALQAGRGGAWDWNINTDEVWWSPELYGLWGIEPGTRMTLQTSLERVHEEDREMLRQSLARASSRGEDLHCEFRIRHPRSGMRWMSSRGRLIFDDAGSAAYMRGITLDITERKQAENDLADREKYLRTILQTTADGFCMLSGDGRILDANEAYCRMTGYGRAELIGMGIDAIDAVAAPEAMAQRIARILAHGSELFETRHRRKDGAIIDVELSVAGLGGNGGRLVCSCRDITERKKIQAETAKFQTRIQQAQKMESIGYLAGGIAHDFNNILFPILGFSEMLLEELTSNESAKEKVLEIISAARRGSDLVRQILAFSRQAEHQVTPVRIQQVLNEVLNLVRATIPSDILITQKIQKECGMVLADPTQLHQIAMNLITNAYHAVEQNRGTIDVSLQEVELGPEEIAQRLIEPGRYARISIADTGCGIEPEIMEKIFEPYFTTKEKGKGTGLGLSVVYGIVKEHKGDIRVYSEPGKGTVFHVFLPLVEKKYDAGSVKAKLPVARGSERILLVDDEVAVARLEKSMLERLGYQVNAHTSSIKALESFHADPEAFDLVFTDMTMPHKTGDQLAQAVRAIKPGIPIIICTGFSERIDPQRASDLGIDGFLMKPLVRAELAHMVRQVLDRAKVQVP